MFSTAASWKFLFCGWLIAVCCVPAAAAERRTRKPAEAPPAEQVELFAAVKAGQLDVRFVPHDSTEARVLFENKTKRPLRVQLPEAFAASPVLAQFGGGVAGGGQAAGVNAGGGSQSVGGGMGMGGPGGVGAGGGFFNVPAEKTRKLSVPLVCLEHGKREPRPAVPYELKPLDQFSSDPVLKQLLVTFGKGSVNQRAVQAATWHLTDSMSWRDLANKHIERLGGADEPYFTAEELRAATELVASARRSAAEQPADSKPADSKRDDSGSSESRLDEGGL